MGLVAADLPAKSPKRDYLQTGENLGNAKAVSTREDDEFARVRTTSQISDLRAHLPGEDDEGDRERIRRLTRSTSLV